MFEAHGKSNYEIERDDQARVDEVMRMIEKTVKEDVFADPVEKSLFIALLPQLSNDGIVREHLSEVFALRRQSKSFFPTGYALRTLEFSIDKQMRKIFGPNEYPNYFITPAWWHHRDVFSKLDYFTLHEDMRHNLQSNMHNAYAIYPLLAHAYKDRFGEKPTVLDNGASLGLGLKKWLLDDDTFPSINVVMPPRPGQPIVPGEMDPDIEFQEIIDHLSTISTPIVKAVGYDTIPVNTDDPEAVARVFSHTFPMSESARRPEEVAEFIRLCKLNESLDGEREVRILRDFVDATDEHMLTRLLDYLPDRGADIGIYSAVLFEHQPEIVSLMLENTKEYYTDQAPMFFTDFARADPKAPNGLSFIRGNWWHRPGSFALFVKDPMLGAQPVELARFSNRRCEEMWLSREGRKIFRKAAEMA